MVRAGDTQVEHPERDHLGEGVLVVLTPRLTSASVIP
jgi:hypothetical protein